MDSPQRIHRERQLHQAALSGDERAWRTLHEETFAALRAYILWRCGGLRHRAEEIMAESWLVAVRRLDSFDATSGSFLGWLRGIAANLLRNAFRREERSAVLPIRHQGEPADAEAMRREEAERVALALASLPEHYEMVLRLRYLEGHRVAAIAELRGETIKGTESLLSRAREAFREAFDHE